MYFYSHNWIQNTMMGLRVFHMHLARYLRNETHETVNHWQMIRWCPVLLDLWSCRCLWGNPEFLQVCVLPFVSLFVDTRHAWCGKMKCIEAQKRVCGLRLVNCERTEEVFAHQAILFAAKCVFPFEKLHSCVFRQFLRTELIPFCDLLCHSCVGHGNE